MAMKLRGGEGEDWPLAIVRLNRQWCTLYPLVLIWISSMKWPFHTPFPSHSCCRFYLFHWPLAHSSFGSFSSFVLLLYVFVFICSWSFLYCSFLAFVDFNLVLILLSRVFLIAFLLVIALLICHCSLLLCSFLPIHAIGIRLWDACWRLTKSLSLAASAIKKLEFGFLEHWLLAYFMHFRLL